MVPQPHGQGCSLHEHQELGSDSPRQIRRPHHPSEYKIGDIVQIFEEQGELIDCFEPHECALAKCYKLRSLLNEATRDFYSRLNTATLETLTNSDEIREIISGKDLLRAQPDAPTPPSSELIRLMEERVARELRKARQ